MCDESLFVPLRWACRHIEHYDAAARSTNDLLLRDVSLGWVTFLGISCIVLVIVTVLFACRHQP